jgi:hypothetical protein
MADEFCGKAGSSLWACVLGSSGIHKARQLLIGRPEQMDYISPAT